MSTFQQIGDRIEKLKVFLGKSVAELEKGRAEDYPGRDDRLLGNATISGWIDKPITWTSDKLEKFLTYWNVDKRWWETGEGEILLTSVRKPTSNNEMNLVYKDLIEANTEYRLIPKRILDDYDMLPKKEVENRNKMVDILTQAMDQTKDALIEKYEVIIQGYENRVKRLEKENEDLQRQIPAKQ